MPKGKKGVKRRKKDVEDVKGVGGGIIFVNGVRKKSQKNLSSLTCPKRESIKHNLWLEFRSWAHPDKASPFESHFKLHGHKKTKINKRGHTFLVFNAFNGELKRFITFDTWADVKAYDRASVFLKLRVRNPATFPLISSKTEVDWPP